MQTVIEKIDNRIIDAGQNILQALQFMDLNKVKLLFVFDDNKFISVLSIGDLQRAIIKNKPLDTPVMKILREDITVAYISESPEEIKNKMFSHRTECMPVVDTENNLVNVYFWEEIFPTAVKRVEATLNLPVVIMAGGKGTRLKPLTNIIPKPLIPIGEKPIIEVIIDKFRQYGTTEFFISVNYKQELVRFYFDNLDAKDYTLNYITEKSFSGTAGSLSLLKGKIDKTFFVTNCDILIDNDYTEIYNYHVDNKHLITIVGSLKHFKLPYGTLETGENGELLSLQEKPETNYMINTGMYVLEPSVLDSIPEDKFYHITDLINAVKTKGKVGVFPVSEGSWFDMGEWPEYQKVIDKYNAGK